MDEWMSENEWFGRNIFSSGKQGGSEKGKDWVRGVRVAVEVSSPPPSQRCSLLAFATCWFAL